jgi:hypothetical protein
MDFKQYIGLILLLIPIVLTGQPYYVGTNGDDDTGDGSKSNPWFNVGYAMNQCSAGDTVYALSGTYDYDSQQTVNVSGTSGNYIVLISEAGHPDSVVFDFNNYPQSTTPSESLYGIYAINQSYLKFERFSLRRLLAIDTDQGRAHGMYFQNCDELYFDWLVIDSIAGRGIQGYNSRTATFRNCDFSWCADPQDADPGNAGVGIIYFATTDSFTDTLKVIGCRFWQNADQGIETLHGNVAILDSCWAWDNELQSEGYTSGTGNGFKPALGFDSNTPITMQRCISAFNIYGINENTSSGGYKFNFNCYSNTIYNNSSRGILSTNYPTGGTSRENIYKNNLVFDNGTYDLQIQDSITLHEYNSFDCPFHTVCYGSYFDSPSNVNTSDFISVPSSKAECATILGADRGSDGSLPDIGDYFKLASTSDLIDAGTDVGLSYSGTAPDIGAFEYTPPTRFTLGGSNPLRHNGKTLIIRQ